MKCEIRTTQGMFLWELTQMNSVIKNNKIVQEEKVKKGATFGFLNCRYYYRSCRKEKKGMERNRIG